MSLVGTVAILQALDSAKRCFLDNFYQPYDSFPVPGFLSGNGATDIPYDSVCQGILRQVGTVAQVF